jgi:glycosyltransferase involved in cell wall biosynthesis
MTSPKFSIIIPAYNNAEFLVESISSCLNQTFPNLELIVVNDASPDNTDIVMRRFDDRRIKYLVHKKNKGLSAARNTGIRASTGEYIALLDGDDIFHPKKLEIHYDFLQKHPEIGVTYNPRFELNHSSSTIRDLWRPPITVSLVDLVSGFPFSPSDTVLRREWAYKVNLFDERYTYVGEDLDINCRLGFAGCKFASVNKALNYRRYHSDRIIKDLRATVDNTLRPLIELFQNPDCPAEILKLKNKAFSSHLLLWSVIAFLQDDTALGQEYCFSAVNKNSSILIGNPSKLLDTLIYYSIVDESKPHESILRRLMDQLPPEFAVPDDRYKWAVARGYLLRGMRAIIWGRIQEGADHFTQAVQLGAQVDQTIFTRITAQLLDFEAEFGPDATRDVIRNLSIFLERIGGRPLLHRLNGSIFINQAFRSYEVGNYPNTVNTVIKAAAEDPKFLSNRGVLSILFRSIIRKATQPGISAT